MEQIFFRAMFALLNDKQVVKITTTRTGDKLTLLINKDNKLITMTGNPEEVDNAIMNHLKVDTVPTEQSFNVTVQDAPEAEDGKTASKSTVKSSGKKKAAAKKVAPKAKKVASDAKSEVKKPAPSKTEKPADNSEEIQKAKERLKEFKEEMDLGDRAMKQGNYDEAIKVFEIAATKAPEGNTKATEKMEAAKQALEKHQQAEKKKEFDELMALGLTQRNDRKYEDSLETFKKAIAMFPDNAEAIKQLSSAEKWIKALAEL